MKKWYKFSLASLVVPAIGGISMVTVGCGDSKASDAQTPQPSEPGTELTKITKPLLKQDAKIGSAQTIQKWCDAFNKDKPGALKVLNALFSNDVQLTDAQVSTIVFTADTTKNTISVSITLNKTSFVFDDNTDNCIFNGIPYEEQLPLPQLAAEHGIYSQDTDVQKWWESVSTGKDAQAKWNAIKSVFTPETQLDVNEIKDITGQPNVEKHSLQVTIELNTKHFDGGSSNWTTAVDSPILYFRLLPVPTSEQQGLMPKYKGGKLPLIQWWEANYDTLEKRIQFANDNIATNKIDTSLVSDVTITPGISTGVTTPFTFTVTLKDGNVFDDSKHSLTWTSDEISYSPN